jgi:hypothetical protein
VQSVRKQLRGKELIGCSMAFGGNKQRAYGSEGEEGFWLEIPMVPPVFCSESGEVQERKAVGREIEFCGVRK